MGPSKFCAVKLGESMNQPIWSHMRVESFPKISGGVGYLPKMPDVRTDRRRHLATRSPDWWQTLGECDRGPRVRLGPRSWFEKVQGRGSKVKFSAQDVVMPGLPKRGRLRGSDGAAWV